MSKKVNVLGTSDSGFKITLNQSNEELEELFAQFKQDFSQLPNILSTQTKNLLAPTSINQRKPPRTKSQDKKRMKLIDYIYIKNTAKKNQRSSKIEKAGVSANELRKSRMKEGKQKAFKSIVDDLISELKEISGKALVMADIANQNLTYTGNTDDIAKLCNIRRILKDSILPSMGEIQKLMGVQTATLTARSRQKIQEEEEEEFTNKIKRLEAIGVQRVDNEQDSLKPVTPKNTLIIKHRNSNKDTWISERLEQREDP